MQRKLCIIHAKMKDQTTDVFTLLHVFDQQLEEDNAISYSRIHIGIFGIQSIFGIRVHIM